ncbi:ATP-binding protein [Vibrio cholerae]|uniref:ATP-binding protein n=1 Tax=Vibrio cholerae TaxID=666 RepID=A0A5Q6PEF0_VIBCL|nr:ATP-binding protein [Vibrio cholerae]KAA1252989.1 ATP-binding protein [Vibrio cholerae]
MNIITLKKNAEHYKSALKSKGFENESKIFEQIRFGRDNDRVDFELKGTISNELINALIDISKDLNDIVGLRECEKLKMLIDQNDTTIIKSLKVFRKSLEEYILKDHLDGWIYGLTDNNVFIPYLVSNIVHTSANPETGEQASVKVYYDFNSPKKGSRYGRSEFFIFNLKDVHGYTLSTILAKKGLFKETKELQSRYNNQMALYEQYSRQIGAQFIGNGSSESMDLRTYRKIKNDKLVVDEDPNRPNEFNQTTRTALNKGSRMNLGYFDDDNITESDDFKVMVHRIPYHPFIKMFSLAHHECVWMLADEIVPYEYTNDLSDKLVLPEDHKDLIDILINDADIVLDDIVGNKSGGTVILSKGAAGLGKTLTAEVYAECVQKPLYSVHAGQLGIKPEEIESRLDKILDNAEKWKAILLLDEADVYIRRRDNDMSHSAIVAAFLRKIERYNGILFMTTNRENDVDEAIASRCSAILKYELPSDNELFKIWTVLSKHYKIEMSNELINKLIDNIENMVGRDVKELLKLAARYKSQRNVEIDYDIFRKCAIFRGLSFKGKGK